MIIIEASIQEVPIIKQLAHTIWPEAYKDILSKAQLAYMLDLFYSKAALENQLQEKKQQFILIKENTTFIGFAAYELNADVQKAKIHKLYVLPNKQGLGLGKKLLKYIEQKAIDAGQEALFLNVNRYNTAIHFYEKNNFKIIQSVDISIGNGYLMEDYIMEKVL